MTSAHDATDAAVLLEGGRRHEEDGDDVGAVIDFEAALGLAMRQGDVSSEVAARSALVRLHHAAGRARDLDAQLERIEALLASPMPDSVARADALAESGLVLLERGGDANARLDKAIALAAERPPSEQARRVHIRALVYRAHADRLQGDYTSAKTRLESALAFAEEAFGDDAQETADVLNALGMLGKFSGEFDAAEEAYARAARIVEALHGPDHPDMAAVYHNLGGLAHARGDFAAAEPLARRSVEIRERTSGPDHLTTVLDRAGLAAILSDLHRDDEATTILERVLAELEVAVGREHREYAVTLNNLAALDQRRGDIEAAERRYRLALEIKERTQGPTAPALATTLNNLGTVLRRQGRVDEARAAYARACQLLEGVVARDHPTLVAVQRNMARIDDEVVGHRTEHGSPG